MATIKNCHMVNPATLIPTGPLEHDRIETIYTIYSSRPNLGSGPLPTTKEESSQTGAVLWKRKKPWLDMQWPPRPKSEKQEACPQGLLPKWWPNSLHLSLRVHASEDLLCLHRFSLCVCHPARTRGYLEGKTYTCCRDQMGKTWLKQTEALRSSTISKERGSDSL